MSYTGTTPIGDRLSIRFNVGTDPGTGDPIYRTRSFSNIKPGVADTDVHELAEKMVALSNVTGATQVQRHVGNSLEPSMLSGGA